MNVRFVIEYALIVILFLAIGALICAGIETDRKCKAKTCPADLSPALVESSGCICVLRPK